MHVLCREGNYNASRFISIGFVLKLNTFQLAFLYLSFFLIVNGDTDTETDLKPRKCAK